VEGDVEVSVVTLASNLSIAPHVHDRFQMVIVLEGFYVESTEAAGGERWLGPGSIVLRAPAVPHSNWVGSREAKTLLIDFDSNRFAKLRRALLTRPAVYSFDYALGELGREVAAEVVRGDQCAPESMKCYTALLSARSSRLLAESTQTGPPAWFSRALAMARAEGGRGLSVSGLASKLGIHPATLTGAFRQHQGMTTRAFLTGLRVQHAARELAQSGASLDEIALDCGFCDQAHLGRHFKRRYGMTPAAYRRCLQR
jgi:AraC-like DNA-binding protein